IFDCLTNWTWRMYSAGYAVLASTRRFVYTGRRRNALQESDGAETAIIVGEMARHALSGGIISGVSAATGDGRGRLRVHEPADEMAWLGKSETGRMLPACTRMELDRLMSGELACEIAAAQACDVAESAEHTVARQGGVVGIESQRFRCTDTAGHRRVGV
ncbi:hypothetical protein Tco_1251854, partial [Tanacetum coccineum]